MGARWRSASLLYEYFRAAEYPMGRLRAAWGGGEDGGARLAGRGGQDGERHLRAFLLKQLRFLDPSDEEGLSAALHAGGA